MSEAGSRYRRVGWGHGLWLLLGGMPSITTAQAQLAAPPLASSAAPLVFRDVGVIDVRTGKQLPNQTVVVVGTRIRALGRTGTISVPAGARVVEAQGKYLIPGLWDMHVHPLDYPEIAYPLLLANGVTGVRDAGSPISLATFAQWKREIAAGTRIGPRLLVSGPQLFEAPDTQTTVTQDYHQLHIPRAALARVVDSLHTAGADFLKTYGLSREGYFMVAAEARRVGIPFGGHLPVANNHRGAVDGREASDSGAMILDHKPYFLDDACGESSTDSADLARCTAAAQQLRRNHTWVTLTGYALIDLAGQPNGAASARTEARFWRYQPHSFHVVRDSSRRAFLRRTRGSDVDTAAAAVVWHEPMATRDWRMRPDGLAFYGMVHRAGIPVLIGTDGLVCPPLVANALVFPYLILGFKLHEGLVGFVLAGWTPLEALQLATLEPARVLGATDSLGTVDAGKVADLVLLDADPLADIWNTTKIRAVVANGRYYDRAALDRLLAQAEQAAARR